MAKAPPRMVRVELFIEVPAHVADPAVWDWDRLVNSDTITSKQTPVHFVRALPVPKGNA